MRATCRVLYRNALRHGAFRQFRLSWVTNPEELRRRARVRFLPRKQTWRAAPETKIVVQAQVGWKSTSWRPTIVYGFTTSQDRQSCRLADAGATRCKAGSSSSEMRRMLESAVESGMPAQCVRMTRWLTPNSFQ